MAIFRKADTQAIPLIVSVSGVRLGQRVLVVPGRDLRILVDLAGKVGLTGRTLALAPAPACADVASAAERAGVVVDASPLQLPLPVAADSFDLAVVDDRSPRAPGLETATLLPEILLALRQGGRMVVLLPTDESWIRRLLGGGDADPPGAPALLRAFGQSGFRAARTVAVRDGVGYLEATRSPA